MVGKDSMDDRVMLERKSEKIREALHAREQRIGDFKEFLWLKLDSLISLKEIDFKIKILVYMKLKSDTPLGQQYEPLGQRGGGIVIAL